MKSCLNCIVLVAISLKNPSYFLPGYIYPFRRIKPSQLTLKPQLCERAWYPLQLDIVTITENITSIYYTFGPSNLFLTSTFHLLHPSILISYNKDSNYPTFIAIFPQSFAGICHGNLLFSPLAVYCILYCCLSPKRGCQNTEFSGGRQMRYSL